MNLEPLVKTLAEEAEIYNEIIELEKKKTVAIVDGNVEKLDKILAEEQMYGMKINNCEKRRMGITDGLGLEKKTLLEVIKIAKNPEKTRLFRLYQQLVKSIKTIKEINEYNSILIKSRLEVVTEINDFIYRAEPKKTGKKTTYNRKAVVSDEREENFKIKKKI